MPKAGTPPATCAVALLVFPQALISVLFHYGAFEAADVLHLHHLTPAHEALARLHEKQGDSARSIEVMIRVADLTADGRARLRAAAASKVFS